MKKEKTNKMFTLSWAMSYQGGAMLISATVASYYSIFMTDTIGITPAVASVIMFFATLWDAINDPIMGTIADRTHTKHGRYRPYFLFFPALFVVVSCALFINPQFSNTGKIIYTAVFYILYGMLFTAIVIPWQAVLPAHIKEAEERNKAVQLGATCMAISFTIASSFTLQFVEFFGGSYVPVIAIYGVICVIMYWMLFKTSTEKYVMPVEKRPVKHDLKILFSHKELFSVIIVWIMSALGYGLMFSSSVYYMMYFYMRPDLIMTYMLVLSIGAIVSMMFLMGIMLKVFRGNVVKVFQISQGITLICYILLFFFGKQWGVTFLYVVSFIATAFGAMEQALINILVNDTIDYIMLKDKVTLGATVSAIKGFAEKCGITLSSSGILAVLAATGYVAGAIGGQPESAMIGINILRFGLPALASMIIIGCLAVYPISKHYDDIVVMKENLEAEIIG